MKTNFIKLSETFGKLTGINFLSFILIGNIPIKVLSGGVNVLQLLFGCAGIITLVITIILSICSKK